MATRAVRHVGFPLSLLFGPAACEARVIVALLMESAPQGILEVMRPAPLALAAAVIPTVAILAAFYLSADAGHIPKCNPFIDGCASISATGREPPGALLFRAVQLPYAAVLALLWILVAQWVMQVTPAAERMERWILITGLVGAAALVVYVTFLGTKTPVYSFMRRFGIYFYFLGTVLTQLLVALRVRRAAPTWRLDAVARWMLGCALFPFALGILNLALKSVLENPDPPENAIEWIASLSMQAWFIGLYVAWRRTDYRVSSTVQAP